MPKTSITPFALAERAIISLYDGGVLSPAVLERLLGTFAAAKTDWDTEPTERSVDGRSLHEVVALTMLPGESLRAARKSFMSVIEHVAGATRTEKASRASRKTEEVEEEKDEPAEDDESLELAEQLTGSTRGAPSNRKRNAAKANKPDTSAERPTRTAGFNPLVNAAAPRKSRS
ncbi:hypothetical protein EN871_05700 [bacterium M00.F.Ca.ET.228.01.1.1]|uniref:hypothetical protein n=2 Tax=Pseudomonadota TaxID=1224 RepID=UPI0010921473|nr:hypothetical protein [Paraburkholderia phenoliruptrix]MBW9097088.1 hypothetical protein [Paraburkholderia phenoliruptrix]TGP45956.1 hypothetical protein EN871_05700 [bacterium M00.F.Ca.ET.228.01.1.1]TGS04131.1 hypothetical protein EN834_07285 [bacterium M00.F.Ca.ET.191.01.1.1]TGU07249.1 hypothetical protein EN798_09775 [bacterium M00.F.Ca.ET.155.01.1.1]